MSKKKEKEDKGDPNCVIGEGGKKRKNQRKDTSGKKRHRRAAIES